MRVSTIVAGSTAVFWMALLLYVAGSQSLAWITGAGAALDLGLYFGLVAATGALFLLAVPVSVLEGLAGMRTRVAH
ncbi:MAG TPA: hypothetical protein VGR28_05060 [Candidatus Thermoplasmatota archaeon]|jgi:hypothetical protein|nr:hypothetical protein [Candidatus Thermoplasmatota archaeon]